MDREDSGATASQSHSFPLAARTLVSTPGLPVKVFPPVQVSLPGQKTHTQPAVDTEQDLLADWMEEGGGGGTGYVCALFMCICTEINVDAHMLMHVRTH